MEVEGRNDGMCGQRAAGGRLTGGGATVPGLRRGTEVEVIGQQQWEEIRRRHEAGETISAIARISGWIARRCEAA